MKSLKIRIDDDDVYFSSGLQLYISDYARKHNKSVDFLEKDDEEQPNLVLTTPARRVAHWCTPSHGEQQQLVFIRERAPAQVKDTWREIYRTGSLKMLTPLLARLFASEDEKGERPERIRQFTVREKQVISYLRKGWEQSKVAKVMGVSVKTVHSHKRSVMSKLMLHRHHDFIYWLLSQDGEYS